MKRKRTRFTNVSNGFGAKKQALGLIELNADLDVEIALKIFVRNDSRAVPLNVADIAMMKMAANKKYNGYELRKRIDYTCHLAIPPEVHVELARARISPVHLFFGRRIG